MKLHKARTKPVSDLPICCPAQKETSTPTELKELVIDLDSTDRVRRWCHFCGASWGVLVRYLVVEDLSGGGFDGQKALADALDIDEGPFDPTREPTR